MKTWRLRVILRVGEAFIVAGDSVKEDYRDYVFSERVNEKTGIENGEFDKTALKVRRV